MALQPDKWETVKALFEDAQEMDSAGRSDFLNEAVSDPEVRAEVERLLAEYDKAGDFLSTPALRALQRSDPPPEAPALDVPEEDLKARVRSIASNHESARGSLASPS